MDPVEINAGTWYLRALRADDRLDDRPAILASAQDPEITRWQPRPDPTLEAAAAVVAAREAGWTADHTCSWAVCEPTTGAMVAEIALDDLDLDAGTAVLRCWALAAGRRAGALADALPAALRFAFAGLGLDRVEYPWVDGDEHAARLAGHCGFTEIARREVERPSDGGHMTLIVTARRANAAS
jgi:RimJ/RimL family protein N-acetyltransferase